MSSSSDINKKLKLPIIYYEEPENGYANPIPYIEMDKEEEWPSILFIQEYRHTGEFEPDHKGNPSPIMDMIIHQYVDMLTLKDRVSEETYDIIRVALGMKPLREAQQAGAKILDKVEKNLAEQKKKSKQQQDSDDDKETTIH